MSNDALIIVDMQHDFLPGGALGVDGGFDVVNSIINLEFDFHHVALTRDWHPANHISFSKAPKFVDKSWPPHCVAGTPGAEIHPDILDAFSDAPVFSKGTDENLEAYSGFDGRHEGTSLSDWLDGVDAGDVYVVGLALDYCVRATAIDAALGGSATVILNCTRPVTYETGALAVRDMARVGVEFEATHD